VISPSDGRIPESRGQGKSSCDAVFLVSIRRSHTRSPAIHPHRPRCMKRRSLGPTAPDIFPIGYGGMSLSEKGRPPEAEAIKTIHAVLDAGIELLELSNVYNDNDDDIGHNERLFAKALKSWPGASDRVIVATKGGRWRYRRRWLIDARPEQLRRACERSLSALGVERIDLYQLNHPDPNVPFAESMGTLADLKSEGKIRWVGISNADLDQIRVASSIAGIESVQNRLNPFSRLALKRDEVPYCAKLGIGFLAYQIYGGRHARRIGMHPLLKRIGKRHGTSPYSITVAWLLAKSDNVIPLVGARTIGHVRDALRGASIELTSEEVKAIDAARFPKWPLHQRIRRKLAG